MMSIKLNEQDLIQEVVENVQPENGKFPLYFILHYSNLLKKKAIIYLQKQNNIGNTHVI